MFLMQHFNPFMCLQHEAHKKIHKRKQEKIFQQEMLSSFCKKKKELLFIYLGTIHKRRLIKGTALSSLVDFLAQVI